MRQDVLVKDKRCSILLGFIKQKQELKQFNKTNQLQQTTTKSFPKEDVQNREGVIKKKTINQKHANPANNLHKTESHFTGAEASNPRIFNTRTQCIRGYGLWGAISMLMFNN